MLSPYGMLSRYGMISPYGNQNRYAPDMSAKSKKGTHILPLKLYLGVGIALLVLTATTVTIAQIPLGPYNLVVAMCIATIKALLVAFFFMHLWFDNKFYLVIFGTAIAFLGIFIMLTMFDTMRRGDIYQEVAKPFQPEAVIYEKATPDTTTSHDTTGVIPSEHK